MPYVRESRTKGIVTSHAVQTDADAPNAGDYTSRASTIANGGTVSTATITTTQRCLIIVFGCAHKLHSGNTDCEIQRDGVTVTTTKQTSATNARGSSTTTLYIAETLDAGTYVYTLINGSGGNKSFEASGLVAYAVEVSR